jgi:hypothetical protein
VSQFGQSNATVKVHAEILSVQTVLQGRKSAMIWEEEREGYSEKSAHGQRVTTLALSQRGRLQRQPSAMAALT